MGSQGVEEEELDVMADENLSLLFDAMEDNRERARLQGGKPVLLNFRVAPRQGKGTLAAHGVLCDAMRGVPRGHLVEKWCKKYHTGLSGTYALSIFDGEEGATEMARAWCHKLEYFYNIYQRVADEGHVYTDLEVQNYAEEEEFSQYALTLTTRDQLKRLEELRGLVPAL